MFPKVLESGQSLFKRFFYKSEMVAEGVGLSAVYSRSIGFRIVRADGDAFREFRFGDRSVHIDTHLVATTDVVIAHIVEEFLWFFSLAICAHTRRKTEFGRYIFQST